MAAEVIVRDHNLDHLSDAFRPKAFEILARLTEAGIPCRLIETLRSEEAHAEDVANGRSWVKRSKHQDGNAIDVCPYLIFDAHGANKLNWNAADPIWKQLGAAGKRVAGVGWGGDWTRADLGHFELA